MLNVWALVPGDEVVCRRGDMAGRSNTDLDLGVEGDFGDWATSVATLIGVVGVVGVVFSSLDSLERCLVRAGV